jgi:AAA15 family ATPase/GTPase
VNTLSHRSENLFKKQFSDAIKEGYKESILEALRILDADIEEIEFLIPHEDPFEMARLRVLRGDISLQIKHKETGFLPVSSFGDGLRRILHIALQLPKLRGGVLLIDEIEVSIHASKLGMFFDWLVKNCQAFQIQLFATTHSLEAIDAILGEKGERAESITAFRLQQGVAKRFSGEQLKRLRLERGLEVRGT